MIYNFYFFNCIICFLDKVDSSGVDFMGSPLSNVRIESGSASGLTAVRTAALSIESLGEVGQMLIVGRHGAVTSARDVYVASLEPAFGDAKAIPTMVSPALRVSSLSALSGSIAVIGLHGDLVAKADLEMVSIDSAGNAVSIVEAETLLQRGKSVSTMLRVPQLATGSISPVADEDIKVHADIDFRGHKLRGATIVESSLTDLDELGVSSLTLRTAVSK